MLVIFLLYGFLALIELGLLVSFAFNFKSLESSNAAQEPVSVLVCARNEEKNLHRCLDSLLASVYDMSLIEILIGNDNSFDRTGDLIKVYEKEHKVIRGIEIQEQKGGLIAKGNVLAQLVDHAKHEKILIIDADMKVARNWLKVMTSLLNKFDLISGLTMVDKEFHKPKIQFFDWAVVLHSMKAMADLWQPISILGNNMGFKRSSYERVGGFKALGPTDVEDLGLLRRFQKANLKTFQYLGAEGLAYTIGQNGWKAMLEQRCRWMNGVFTHHWALGILALFARLWLLMSVLLLFIDIDASLWVFCYGLFINAFKYYQLTFKIKNSYYFAFYIPALISLLDTFALIRLMVFGKVSWKGRKF